MGYLDFLILEWFFSANQLIVGLLSFLQHYVCNRKCKLILNNKKNNLKILASKSEKSSQNDTFLRLKGLLVYLQCYIYSQLFHISMDNPGVETRFVILLLANGCLTFIHTLGSQLISLKLQSSSTGH